MRWRDIAAKLEAQPGFREAFEQQFPYANVALAVVSLRERHGLTQRALADRINSPQPVIARLESGRQPVEIKLLARIADAVGDSWSVSFGLPVAEPTEPELARVDDSIASTGDPLLDAFNAANTASDLVEASRVAAEIALDPSTPRRRLALALEAYNRADHVAAERWGRDALAADDLPDGKREVATLVVGRAVLSQGRPRDALRALRPLKSSTHIGWLGEAALAEAHLEAGQADAAQKTVERILATTSDPAAHYLAARVYWHRDQVWPALEHVAMFRAADPDDPSGLMLHGSILGFIADLRGDPSAHEAALPLFDAAKRSGDCEAVRLYAVTAARLGDWGAALKNARALLRQRDGHEAAKHVHDVEHIVAGVFEGLPDTADYGATVDAAARILGNDHDLIRLQRALAAAVAGDVKGAAKALRLDLGTIEDAPPAHQLAVAAGYLAASDPTSAVVILARQIDELSVPDGLLRLAGTALELGDAEMARRALERLAESSGPIAEVAALASRLVRNLERSNESAMVTGVLSQGFERIDVVRPRTSQTTIDSTWEGRHLPASAVMDRLTRSYLN